MLNLDGTTTKTFSNTVALSLDTLIPHDHPNDAIINTQSINNFSINMCSKEELKTAAWKSDPDKAPGDALYRQFMVRALTPAIRDRFL